MLLNGATGTNLLDKGLAPGESPSVLNLRNPQAVFDVQRAYVNAGSDIILTNTFSANPLNISSTKLKKVITEGARLARRAAGNKASVFGDIGPLGELIRPYGELSFDEACKIFSNIAKILYQAGIEIFLVETFTSIIEAKAAFLAAHHVSENVIVSLSLQDNGRTIMGETPESIAITFEELGAQGVGINCTLPDVAIEAVTKMAELTNLPLLIKPNAGKVEIVGNKIHHTLSDADMAKYYQKFVKCGANIIGGCCGTTPAFIKHISKKAKVPKQRKVAREFVLASPNRLLKINEKSTIIVGERLNPSGRKRVKKRLLAGDFKIYAEEAKAQENAGADVLDVNAFLIDLDEKETLKNAVHEVVKNCQLPLFIDTLNCDAAQEVMASYPGIGVYNSIPARKKELIKWLPLVKRYGFKAVISLVGKAIPKSIEDRMKNVRLTLNIANKIGFSKRNLIFDPLVYSVATEQVQINYTLETISQLHKMGLKTVLGISNVSFGLPNRSLLNAALAIASIKSGVTFLILNPLDETVMNSVASAKILFEGELPKSKIQLTKKTTVTEYKKTRAGGLSKKDLTESIICGDTKASVEYAQMLLNSGMPAQVLIDKYISKSLKRVGDYYESGEFFIPDLLKAAEASKSVLSVIKKHLPKGQRRGKVMLATVKGDIHDIGKNIAGMIFASAGYEVIDLGKDVPEEKIIKALRVHKPDALGLSALLTTTMPQMEKIIRRLKKERISVKVIIGGPNVSARYAQKIGAYGSAKNVLEGLKILKKIR